MILEPWLWVVAIAAAIPVALASAVAAWRRRPDPGTRPLTVMLFAVAWWAATYLGELGAGTLDGTLFWARLEWTGSLLIPVAWLAFALEYTGREEYVTPRTVGALMVPWLASLVLVWTNPLHHLVRTPVGLTDVGGLLVLDQQYGPWFLLAAAYTYVLVAAGAGMLVAMVTSDRVLYRGQAVALLVAALVPLAVNAHSIFVSRIDLTPFAFSVTGVAVLVAMSRYDLLAATPVAALVGDEAVIESMDAAVLVVDSRGTVVRANESTERLLGRSGEHVVGEPLADVVPDGASGNRRFVRSRADRSDRLLEVTETDLRDRRDRRVGRIVVVRDVTENHERLERIEVLNRVLRHNLRNEVNLVVGYLEDIRSKLGADAPAEIERIDEVVRTLLDISERARQTEAYLDRSADVRQESVAAILDRVTADVAARHPDGTVTVESTPPDSETANVLLEPVVENLVDNGLRHDPGPDPHVAVRASVEGDLLEVEIEDDGPGIPESERAVLTAGPETPLSHASGLGLWLVEWSLTRIDGSLSFESPPDGGTLVRVRVPRGGSSETKQSASDRAVDTPDSPTPDAREVTD